VFALPGDYNLAYLKLLAEHKPAEHKPAESNGEGITSIYCTNELNMGYMADGYARANGAACFVTTFGVGALSAINAFAGSVCEDVTVLHVSIGPRSCEAASNHVVHHTLGITDTEYVVRAYAQVCPVALRMSKHNAYSDMRRVKRALEQKTCVYLEIPMDLVDFPFSKAELVKHEQPKPRAASLQDGRLLSFVDRLCRLLNQPKTAIVLGSLFMMLVR